MYLNGKNYKGIAITNGNASVDTVYSVGLLEALLAFRNNALMAQLYGANSFSELPIPVIRVNPHESPDYLRALDETEWLRINLGFDEWMHSPDNNPLDWTSSTLMRIWKVVCDERILIHESEIEWAQSIHYHVINELDSAIRNETTNVLTDAIECISRDPEQVAPWTLMAITRAARIFTTLLIQCDGNAKLFRSCIKRCDCFQIPALMSHHIAILPREYPNHIISKAYPNAMFYVRAHFDVLAEEYRSPDRYVITAISDDTASGKQARWKFPMLSSTLERLRAGVTVDPDGKTMEFDDIMALKDFIKELCEDSSRYGPTEWGARTFKDRPLIDNGGLTIEQIERLPTSQRVYYGAAIDLVEDLQSVVNDVTPSEAPAGEVEPDHLSTPKPGPFMEDPN